MLIYEIEIKNWEKYNPRNDQKTFHWFRFDADFFRDPIISCLPSKDVMVLIVLFTERCRANCAKFKLTVKVPAILAKVSEKEFIESLNALQDAGMIDVSEIRSDPAGSVRIRSDPCSTIRYDTDETRRDETFPTGSPPAQPVPRKKSPTVSKGGPIWEAYSTAYESRYGQRPARNARDNSLCAKLVDLIGAEDAAKVAAFYLTHHDRWYVSKLHPLNILVADAQKLRTEWLAGTKMTGQMAKEAEVSDHNDEVIRKYYERKRQAEERSHES